MPMRNHTHYLHLKRVHLTAQGVGAVVPTEIATSCWQHSARLVCEGLMDHATEDLGRFWRAFGEHR